MYIRTNIYIYMYMYTNAYVHKFATLPTTRCVDMTDSYKSEMPDSL